MGRIWPIDPAAIGIDPRLTQGCPACYATGKMTLQALYLSGEERSWEAPCERCQGNGWILRSQPARPSLPIGKAS